MSSLIVTPGFDSWYALDASELALAQCFDPYQLLVDARLWGPQLVTHASYFASPTDISTGNWGKERVAAADSETLRETAVVGTHDIYQRIVDGMSYSNGPMSFSVDFKADGRDWVSVNIIGGAVRAAVLNVAAGTVFSQTNMTASVSALGAGWYRATLADFEMDPTTDYIVYYIGTGSGTFNYLGDVTKGIKVTNSQMAQTSIVTAPNDPVLAAIAQALYGDPFHWTNVTKASQPVLLPTVWNGLPGAVFSGASLLYADMLSALYTGTDKPLFAIAEMQWPTGAGTNERLWSLGNSAGGSRQFGPYLTAANLFYLTRFDNAASGKTLVGTVGIANARHAFAHRFTGTDGTEYRDGVVGAGPADLNVGDVTFDEATLGCLRRAIAEAFWKGTIRRVAFGMVASNPQIRAGSRVFLVGGGI